MRLTHLPGDHEGGYEFHYAPTKTDMVGKVFIIEADRGPGGYVLDGYRFPYFVLEKVSSDQPDPAPPRQTHSAPSAKPQLKEVLVQVMLEIEGRGTVTSPAPVGPGWKLTESQKWSFGHPRADFQSLNLVEPVWAKEYVVMSKVHKIWMLEKRFFEREPLVTAAVPEVPYAGLPLLKGLEKQQPLQGSWPNGNHVPGAVKRSQ